MIADLLLSTNSDRILAASAMGAVFFARKAQPAWFNAWSLRVPLGLATELQSEWQ